MQGLEVEDCDHEFEFVDESFDHEFGTEVVHYMQCQKCGFVRDIEPGEFDYDD